MLSQTVLPFKLESTDETLTAHGGLALFGECCQGMRLTRWLDQALPQSGSGAGYAPSTHTQALLLTLHGGGRSLKDVRTLRSDTGLLDLLQIKAIPSSDALGDWLRRMGSDAGMAGSERVHRWLPIAGSSQRGDASENRIKELKLGFGMERMPCGQFAAKAAFFQIGVLAYNLFKAFTRETMADAWCRRQVQTLHWRLYQTAGKVVRHAGQVCLKVSPEVLAQFQNHPTTLLGIIRGWRALTTDQPRFNSAHFWHAYGHYRLRHEKRL